MDLERAIELGDLLPGEKLNELELATRYKTSRTPVREAIQRLEAKGRVEISPRRGAFVAKLDLPRLLQSFEALSEIEGICARLAARRITSEELAELEAAHERYSAIEKKKDPKTYFEASMVFHAMIAKFAKNEVLLEVFTELCTQLAPYRRHGLSLPNRIDNSVREHMLVIEAIRENNAELAEQRMLSHTAFVADSAMLLLSRFKNDA
ncbi:MAG: GntR family transcriptional regulator [Pseudomonadota bacterium]